MNGSVVTSGQQLLEVWQQHTYSEFVLRDAKGALMTMSENPALVIVSAKLA